MEGHLRKDFLGTGSEVLLAKACYGTVIGRAVTLEQVHEVDVPAAGLLDAAGTVDAVHVGIDENGKHPVRCNEVSLCTVER